MKRVWVAMGTRPEVIKLAPVVRALQARPGLEVETLVTAQHREMLDQMLVHFELEVRDDLDLMQPGQKLHTLTARILEHVSPKLEEARPDLLVVQGDTTTTFACSLAAFYLDIPVAHVEAGLRSGNRRSPFPEEMNRILTSSLAALHFPPTERSRQALLREGVREERCHLTGNTVIDALQEELSREAEAPEVLADPLAPGSLVVCTLHRRENFGEPMDRILEGLRGVLEEHPTCWMILPVHPNPKVQSVVREALDHPRVRLTGPLPYPEFCRVLQAADLAISDSGGVQEEAPSVGTPVLVTRENTERPEAVEAGCAVLVGSDADLLRAEARAILADPAAAAARVSQKNPFGDGHASERIAEIIEAAL